MLATNGSEALSIYETQEPNIVILDNKMPLVEGLEVARQIRKTDKNIPIFFTTSSKDTEDLLEAVKLNLVEYILKPLSYDKLESALLACLERLDERELLKHPICENVSYCALSKKITSGDNEIQLTKTEASFIELLLSKKGALVTNEEIDYGIYEGNMTPAAIRNMVARLRKKTGLGFIVNIQNIGYKIG